jgi:uncharacterized Tic20 family protein
MRVDIDIRPASKSAKPGAESRVWAALANGAGVMFGLGVIIATFGWAESRAQRPFAAYQSLQALGYQTLGYTVWLLAYLLVITVVSLALVPLAVGRENSGQGIFFFWMVLSAVLVFGMLGLYLVLPLLAAILTGMGRNFRYPILGQRLEKYLGYDPLAGEESSIDQDHADRWVAAMSQFAVILPLWGLGAPVVALATQRDRAPFLRFQSWQAIVYHLLGFVLYFGTLATYFLSLLPLLLGAGLLSALPGLAGSGIPVVLGWSGFYALLCCSAGIALLIPLYHILGQWAGLRILQGQDYRYPLLGRLVARWTNYSSGIPTTAAMEIEI